MNNNYKKIDSTKELNIYNNKEIPELFKIKLKNSELQSQTQIQTQTHTTTQILLNSIKQTKLLTGLTINSNNNEIIFQANSVTTLKEYEKKTKCNYEKCQILISCLIKQLKNLLDINYSFYGYDLESVIVINENIFLQISTDYLLPIKNKNIIFYSPFKKSFFLSPEVNQITILPSKINYKCIYYSIGALTIYLLLHPFSYNTNTNITENTSITENTLNPINGTKIYWFLMRAIDSNSEKRNLIYI